jgi:hypothetical protein
LWPQELVGEGKVELIGVMQLLNKGPLEKTAEFLAVFFAEFAGVALSNCIHYKQVQSAKQRTNVSVSSLGGLGSHPNCRF